MGLEVVKQPARGELRAASDRVELQLVNTFGELDIKNGDTTLIVCTEDETDLVPPKDIDIGVVVHAFGEDRYGIDEPDGGSKV